MAFEAILSQRREENEGGWLATGETGQHSHSLRSYLVSALLLAHLTIPSQLLQAFGLNPVGNSFGSQWFVLRHYFKTNKTVPSLKLELGMDVLPLCNKMAARRSCYVAAARIPAKVRGISSSACLRSAPSSGDPKVIAMRREEYTVWERRAPLNPQHVKSLVRDGYKVIIQPSARRAYTMSEYSAAGAVLQEDIEEAAAILGVKTMPVEKVIPNRTYSIFSHTIKAQKAQMPLLDAFIEKVQYEVNGFCMQ